MPETTLDAFPLRKPRTHDVFGAGATSFALVSCAQAEGPCLWVSERWRSEQLNPIGVNRFVDPDRLLLATAADQGDALAVAEEALRDGAIALVVIEIRLPLDLKQGRRLQLAAKTGGSTGLCLTPEDGGSLASETRWRASPLHDTQGDTGSTLMRWELLKNKSGVAGAWDVRWGHAARRLDVVSPVGELD